MRGIIEQAARVPLSDILRQAVVDPLGIRLARLAHGQADLDAVEMGAGTSYNPGWVYHGLLVGPLHEAALLLDRLIDGPLLPANLIREMTSARPVGPAIPGRPWRKLGYGLGIMLEAEQGEPLGHTGAGPGSTIAVYQRTTGNGTIVTAAFALGDNQGAVERSAIGIA